MSDRLTRLSEHLYRFDDTCNVYLLADGDAGLLIDAGSGAVLDHLPPAGVERVRAGAAVISPRLPAHSRRCAHRGGSPASVTRCMTRRNPW